MAHIGLAPRRRPSEYPDFFEEYQDDEFFRRFRFRKTTVTDHIYPLVKDVLEVGVERRGSPITPMMQLLGVLRFYATRSFQIVSGDLTYISQPLMSRFVEKISERLAQLSPLFIRFPEGNEAEQVKRQFFAIKRFPGVIGCIDCTHINTKKPGGDINAELYRNRKGKLSLNVQEFAGFQAICGPDLKIIDIVARWPGSARDSRIFDNYSAKLRFDTGEIRGTLLGEGGYAQSEYLFTPVISPGNPAEERYNKAQIRTSQTVERTFGVLKRRFPCLSKTLATKVQTSIRIILACAVLHYIVIEQGDIHTQHYAEPAQQLADVIPQPRQGAANRRGAIIKAEFIRNHFGN